MTTYKIDDETNEILVNMKEVFGVSTNTEILRKALLIAKVVADNSFKDKDGQIIYNLLTKNNEIQPIILNI